MSVIVKGMEMPNACCHCPCSDSAGCAVTGRAMTTGEMAGELGDIDDCPLHPLPEKHGRIVDVGPLEVVAYSLSDHEGESFDDGVEFILEKLDALPTIVEEEG